MKTKQQKVELYDNINDVYLDMVHFINMNWNVHTCMSDGCKILVVYERDYETWN